MKSDTLLLLVGLGVGLLLWQKSQAKPPPPAQPPLDPHFGVTDPNAGW
jgi:hypothetical protein